MKFAFHWWDMASIILTRHFKLCRFYINICHFVNLALLILLTFTTQKCYVLL